MNRAKQKGFSLIEVLITVLILAIGLLGLAALQARSLQYNHAAALRSQANVLASDILDRMRINQSVATSGGYNTAFGQAETGSGTLVANDLNEWKTLLGNTLPSGDGDIQCAANVTCTITIRWSERVLDEDLQNATGFSQFVYTTRL